MSQVSEICDSILNHMRKANAPIADNFQPGLPRDEILELAAQANVPFVLTDSIVDLFNWRNGLKPKSGVHSEFLPYYMLPRFEVILKIFTELRTAEDFPRFSEDGVQWFPVFRSTGTDFLGVRCDENRHADNEVYIDDSDDAPAKRYQSLVSMLLTIEKAYATNVYFFDDDRAVTFGKEIRDNKGNLITVDVSDFNAIAREFNPEIEHFKN